MSERSDDAGDLIGKALPAPPIRTIHPSLHEHRAAGALLGFSLLGRLACTGAGEPSLAWMSSPVPCKCTRVPLELGRSDA